MYLASQRRNLVFSLLLAIALFSSSASHPLPQAPDPNVVKIILGPLDQSGKLVSGLTRNDVRVLDNGVQQTIISFERLADQRISVALLVDNSLSQERLAQTAKVTARGFVETLMQAGRDQVAVVGFSGKATVEQELTTDREKTLQAIERLRFATPASVLAGAIIVKGPDPEDNETAASAIWDTVWSASESLTVSSTWDSRRIILLLSNGVDTFSKRSVLEAIERAQRHDVAVYAIGMGDKNYNRVRESILKKLAEETGGRAFFPKKIAELEGIFGQLAEELRSPYVIRYLRTNRKAKGEIQHLKIQLLNSGSRNTLLDYRRAYVSP